MTARDAFRRHSGLALDRIGRLRDALGRLQAEHEADPCNWGIGGDVEHIHQQLDALLAFLARTGEMPPQP